MTPCVLCVSLGEDISHRYWDSPFHTCSSLSEAVYEDAEKSLESFGGELVSLPTKNQSAQLDVVGYVFNPST